MGAPFISKQKMQTHFALSASMVKALMALGCLSIATSLFRAIIESVRVTASFSCSSLVSKASMFLLSFELSRRRCQVWETLASRNRFPTNVTKEKE